MDKKELDQLGRKKEPLKTEMRRYVEARMNDGAELKDILKDVPQWDTALVTEIFERLKEKKQPDKFYTSIREPLMTDRFD
ncbi:MAG: hypothetical protein V1735_00120 [Nanoarchaeota archaeon]